MSSSHEPYNEQTLLDLDKAHVWHPYAAFNTDNPIYAVESASGTRIKLKNGKSLIDGMSSWWSTLHGYCHPELDEAVKSQLDSMAHVMFGGLTHEPAVRLAKTLVDISPKALNRVFFSDSGSVAVEVAMKMSLQYWKANKQSRTKFLSLQRAYHGDTIGAMSVCDPDTGMHSLFSGYLPEQLFAESPKCKFDEPWQDTHFDNFKKTFDQNQDDIAAVIIEPIVQGTGGMHFYSPEFLRNIRKLCSENGVLLIADEIATGLGRTGKMFACNHADVSPDIMCLGKTLSAGYITLAATLCSDEVALTICNSDPGVFMHGPTFMANPLACSVAQKSIDLLLSQNWQENIQRIQTQLSNGLAPAKALPNVQDVRVLGSIGVIELHEAIDLKTVQPMLVERGIWLRPFGKNLYTIPAYIITDEELRFLCAAMVNTCEALAGNSEQ